MRFISFFTVIRYMTLTRSVLAMMNVRNASSSSSTCLVQPSIGLGTFLMERSQIAVTLRSAIQMGYRRIDCAPVYFNEDCIGDALHDILSTPGTDATLPVVRREDLFVVSKLPSPLHRNVEGAVRKSLRDLRLDYLDLYLIHWPVAFYPVPIPSDDVRGWENEDIDDSDNGQRIDPTVSIHETWSAMEQLVDKGLVRHIGVSNFPVMLLHELLSRARIIPAVNQCEGHPYLQQQQLMQYCTTRGVHFQAYSPLGSSGYKGESEPMLLQDPVFQDIAREHQVSTSTIALAWALQRGTSVVVKSVSPEHLRDNLNASRIVLTEDQMNRIRSLDRNYRFFRPEDWWGSLALAVFH